MSKTIFAAVLAVLTFVSPLAAQDGELTPAAKFSRDAETSPEVAQARAAYLDGDYQTALDIVAPLAEAGDPVAQNVLGSIYEDGIVVERDLDAAIAWWEKAAAQGYDKATYNLGWLLQKDDAGYPDDPEAAIEWIEKAVAMGYSYAYSLRAELYEAGRGGPVDLEAAAEAYETAAEMGVVDAMNQIGAMYIDASGVEESYATALYWFNEAAWTGDAVGLSNLGAMYQNGYGVGQDTLAAMALYESAAERGHALAAVNLGLLLAEWDTGYSDPGRAYGWCLVGLGRANDDDRPGFEEDCAYVAELVGEAGVADGETFAAGFEE